MNPASAGAEHDSQNPQQQRHGEGEQAQKKCYEHNSHRDHEPAGLQCRALAGGHV